MNAMHFFVHLFHLLAAIIWLGGIFYVIVVLMKSMNVIEPPERGKLFGAVGKRFMIISWICVIFILISGFKMTSGEVIFDFSTSKTIVLNIKILLFFVMLIIGLVMTFVIMPKMMKAAPKPGEPPSPEFIKMQSLGPKLATVNLVLGILVIICVAALHGLH